MNRQEAQPVQQQQRQQNGISCWTVVAILLAVNFLIGLIGNANNQQQKSPNSKAPMLVMTNAIKEGDQLDVNVVVANSTHSLFQTRQLVTYSLASEPIDIEFQLTDLQNLQQNLTITAVAEVIDVLHEGNPILLTATANFTALKKRRDADGHYQKAEFGPIGGGANKSTLVPNDFNVLIVFSNLPYEPNSLPVVYDWKRLPNSLNFIPPIDLNQIHIGGRHYSALPNATQNHTTKLHIFCYSEYRYMMFAQFGKRPKLVVPAMQGLMDILQDPQAMDDMKEMLFDNNLYLVGLTLILSVMESVFQILAVKNQINFWRNIESHPGISIKSLSTQLFFTVVIVLYLIDSGASRLVILMQLINIPVCVWKIGKALKLQRQSQFPFFRLKNHSWYSDTIQQYDTQGTRYLYYILSPFFVCYLGWKLYSKSGPANWYSFTLESLVGFFMIFGFVAMTPQLFLNYKLKSVSHLPWRMLVYRFLSTIMDDLYSFLVTMPWLWRLGCFRDDIIFLVYVYQRHIYPTDHTRKDVYSTTQPPTNPQNDIRQKAD